MCRKAAFLCLFFLLEPCRRLQASIGAKIFSVNPASMSFGHVIRLGSERGARERRGSSYRRCLFAHFIITIYFLGFSWFYLLLFIFITPAACAILRRHSSASVACANRFGKQKVTRIRLGESPQVVEPSKFSYPVLGLAKAG